MKISQRLDQIQMIKRSLDTSSSVAKHLIDADEQGIQWAKAAVKEAGVVARKKAANDKQAAEKALKNAQGNKRVGEEEV